MQTASFFTYTGPGRVSIARFPPRRTPKGFRIYKPLAPGPWFNSVARPEYERLYSEQLACLSPAEVRRDLERLAGNHEPVMLCWEKPPFNEDNWCHRRLAAAWFQDKLGIEVPELDANSAANKAVVLASDEGVDADVVRNVVGCALKLADLDAPETRKLIEARCSHITSALDARAAASA